MDDMKKLVERYKRELMEYSKAAASVPKERLEFPEMTEPDRDAAASSEKHAEQQAEEMPLSEVTASAKERAPRIIGYGGDDIVAQFNDIFGEPEAEDEYADVTESGEYSGISTVTPEKAEELDDIPESGESTDEQLGRRDFEEQDVTRNSPEDIRPLEQSGEAPDVPAELEYDTLDDFIAANNRRGTTRFRTYAARGAFPVAGARVVISHIIGGSKHIFYELTTDISGQTSIVTLPAPPKELSETAGSEIQPYATYDAEVTAEGYNDVLVENMPVFEGVMSMQNIALVPALADMPDVIVESEPDLNGGV